MLHTCDGFWTFLHILHSKGDINNTSWSLRVEEMSKEIVVQTASVATTLVLNERMGIGLLA